MRPLLLAASLCLAATGCVVHEHGYYRDDGYRETQPILYSYVGAHPIPAGLGGGWCLVEGEHTHDYAPDYNQYAYNGTYYTYSGPTVVWYYDYHPVPSGGYCTLHGRHSHRYHPGYQYSTYYTYDSGHDYYVYRDPNPGSYHPATTVPAGAQRPPPPPGRGTYQAPPRGTYYGNTPPPPPGRGTQVTTPPPSRGAPPPPGQGSYNPPPGHGGTPPGQGAPPPGQGSHNPPPGHNGTPPGQSGPPPGHGNNNAPPPPGHARPPTVGGPVGDLIPPPAQNRPPPSRPEAIPNGPMVIPPRQSPPPGHVNTPPPFDRNNPIERGNGNVIERPSTRTPPPDPRERPEIPHHVDVPPPPPRTFERPPQIPQNPGNPVQQKGDSKAKGKDKRALPASSAAPARGRSVRPMAPNGKMSAPPPPGRGAGR